MITVPKPKAQAPMVGQDLGRALRETFDLQARVLRNPYGMVAGAVGIGFVLGGGIFTRLAAKMAGAGLRMGLMAALPVLEKELVKAFSISKLDTNRETDQ